MFAAMTIYLSADRTTASLGRRLVIGHFTICGLVEERGHPDKYQNPRSGRSTGRPRPEEPFTSGNNSGNSREKTIITTATAV